MMVQRMCGWTACQSAPQRDACARLPYSLSSLSFFFPLFFPQEPLKLSVPGNNSMFPRGNPNILGIRRHLACKSLFLSLTLYCLFISLSLLLSFSLSHSSSSVSQHCIHSVVHTRGGLAPFSHLLTSQPVLSISFQSTCLN